MCSHPLRWRIFFVVRKSQINKLLGLFYGKSQNFLGVPIRKLQIRKSQIRKFQKILGTQISKSSFSNYFLFCINLKKNIICKEKKYVFEDLRKFSARKKLGSAH